MSNKEHHDMKLIIFSGLPGAGKSKLASHAGNRLSLPVFAKDQLEAALWRAGVGPEMNSGSVAYDLLTSLAEEQLSLGISVILDSVATSSTIRETWRALALKHGAAFMIVECICSDEDLHKERLTVRKRGIEGWPELSWGDVEEVRSRYETWSERRLIVDSVDDFNANAMKMIQYINFDIIEE